MTREKAINIMLQMIKDEEEFLSDDTVEAHKMAISALEQEPCEDAVSREAVLKKIDYEVEHYCKYLEEVDDKRNAQTHVALVSDNIREEVEQLQPVTQKSKIGHWIHLRSDMYECSECGKIYTSFEIGKCDADYCPKCGAKMESEVQE